MSYFELAVLFLFLCGLSGCNCKSNKKTTTGEDMPNTKKNTEENASVNTNILFKDKTVTYCASCNEIYIQRNVGIYDEFCEQCKREQYKKDWFAGKYGDEG